jgi:hypothetical protein
VDGLAPAGYGGRFAFVDTGGIFAFDPRFRILHALRCGLALASTGDLFVFVNRHGQEPLDRRFLRAGEFHEGQAAVCSSGLWGSVDTHGRMNIKQRHLELGNLHEGLCTGAKGPPRGRMPAEGPPQALYGYLMKYGHWKLNPIYTEAGRFSEGVAWVKIKNKRNDGTLYGLIDKEGGKLIKPKYPEVGVFKEGKAWAKAAPSGPLGGRQGLVGYIDIHGEWVIKPAFHKCHDFHNGLAVVVVNDLYGIINDKGEYVIEPQYQYLRLIEEELLDRPDEHGLFTL